MLGPSRDRPVVAAGDRLRQVRRLVLVGLGVEGLERAVGQVEVVVERRPPRQHRRVRGDAAEVAIPRRDAVGPVDQPERRDVVVLQRLGQPPREQEAARGAVGAQRGAGQGLQARAVGRLPEPLGLGADRELAGVEPQMHGEPEPEPLGDLRQLRVQAEPSPREGLDVAVVEMPAVDLSAAAELPEDRFQRQERLVDLGVGPPRDVGPPLGDPLAERGHRVGVAIGQRLDRRRRREERHRGARGQRLGQRPGREGGIDEADVDQVRVDGVEPLARLRQQLERRAEAIGRGRVVARPPGRGPGEDLARQAVHVERVGVPHRGRRVAEHPPRRAQREEVERDPLGVLAPVADRRVAPHPGPDLADQGEPISLAVDEDGAGVLGLLAVAGGEPVGGAVGQDADLARAGR